MMLTEDDTKQTTSKLEQSSSDVNVTFVDENVLIGWDMYSS